jgi:SAM-dependent methyltransferase
VVRELEITPDDRVLDLCCGFGRHLGALDRRGITAIGLDLSLLLLRRVERQEPARRVVCGDMRRLPFGGGEAAFTVVVNFFTSFGYFDSDEENALALHEMARVLAPGGRFSIDLLNARSSVAALAPRTMRRAGPFEVLEERSFDPKTRRIEKRITLTVPQTDEQRSYFESVRVYEPQEIRELVERSGLTVDRLLGDFTGQPFGPETPRMIVLGRKPEGGR